MKINSKTKQKAIFPFILMLFSIIIILGSFYFIMNNINKIEYSLVDFQKETKQYFKDINNNLEKHINLQNNHLKEKINLIEKEMDEFQQETQSNFKKIDEKIDKLEEMIINQNKSNQESE